MTKEWVRLVNKLQRLVKNVVKEVTEDDEKFETF